MSISIFSLSWHSLQRDFRTGQLRLLVLAVSLAVSALTAVGFFADRINGGLQRDARALIGGDALVSSDQPTPQAIVDKARQLGLRSSSHVNFPSMARSAAGAQDQASRLVALKAVSPGYPLRGELKLATAQEGMLEVARTIPLPGQVWVDAALLDALSVKVGDHLLLGASRLQIQKIIAVEPDRGAGFMNFAPRVMMNQVDLAATGLVQPASRVTYRYALASDNPASITAFNEWVQTGLQNRQWLGLRLESLESGRPEMRSTLDRAEKFLNLVALLTALLCAVAVAIAARSYANARLDSCAMLRVLGVSQRKMALAYALEFAWVGLAASAMGVGLGYLVHFGFVNLLKGLVEADLPQPSSWPVLFGLGMGATLLTAFGLPPVLQLAQVPPLRVMRRDVGALKAGSAGVLLLGIAGFSGLLMAASRDAKLGAISVGGFFAAVLIFAGLAYLAVQLLRKTVNEQTAPRWLVLATRQIAARPAYVVVQVSSLALGLLALVLLVLLRTDLISSWRQATPPDAPNRFVINIQPEQKADFEAHLKSQGVEKYDLFPMIRARLVAVNGKTISPDDFSNERAKRMVDREFNLSHSAQLPSHNKIISGKWLNEEKNAISLEEGIAQTLGLKLGDELSFDVAGVVTVSRISSLRKVDWGSLRANFFAMYPVSTLPNVPSTYLSAYKAPATAGFDNRLIRQFPNVTNVDMSLTVAQVQRVLDQVIRAVEFLFGFALLAGIVVLLASVTATRGERTREFAILRSLGASNRLLQNVQQAELAGLGVLAGVLAGAVAILVGWALAKFVFEFTWTASAWVLPAAGGMGAILALLAGWWALRSVLHSPVMATLRQASE